MKSLFLRFLISRTFWKNVALALLITIVLVFGIQIILRLYTDHGEEISVPNFTGMPLQQVDQLCFQQGLVWVIQDSVYVRDSAGGIVMSQYPSAGTKVKHSRKIFITTNAWFPEVIMMPKAYDMPLRQAERVLGHAGLNISSFEYLPYFAENHVIDQKMNGQIIKEGTPIQKGSGITLVIGQGLSNERASVPNLLNLTADSAQARAIRSYFNIGAVTFDYSVMTLEDSTVARVYRQFPNFENQQARLGSSIDIWLSIDSLRLYTLDSLMNHRDSLLFNDSIPTDFLE